MIVITAQYRHLSIGRLTTIHWDLDTLLCQPVDPRDTGCPGIYLAEHIPLPQDKNCRPGSLGQVRKDVLYASG
jgi:hypothetical protein